MRPKDLKFYIYLMMSAKVNPNNDHIALHKGSLFPTLTKRCQSRSTLEGGKKSQICRYGRKSQACFHLASVCFSISCRCEIISPCICLKQVESMQDKFLRISRFSAPPPPPFTAGTRLIHTSARHECSKYTDIYIFIIYIYLVIKF